MHPTKCLEWWINNVLTVRFPSVLSRSPFFCLSSPLQTSLTPKFPNWRKVSAAAAQRVTASFSRWRCCSSPSCCCPSDCRGLWHSMHRWTALSKGLWNQVFFFLDVRVDRNEDEEKGKVRFSENIKGRGLFFTTCILTLYLGFIIIWMAQHFHEDLFVCHQPGDHGQYSHTHN